MLSLWQAARNLISVKKLSHILHKDLHSTEDHRIYNDCCITRDIIVR